MLRIQVYALVKYMIASLSAWFSVLSRICNQNCLVRWPTATELLFSIGDWKNTHIMLMASSPSFKSSFHDLLRGISNKAGLMWTELLQAFGQRQAVMFATLAVGILNSNPLPASYATLNAYGWFPHPHPVDTPAVRKPWWRLLRREMLAAFGVPEFGGEVSATLQLPVEPPTIQGECACVCVRNQEL